MIEVGAGFGEESWVEFMMAPLHAARALPPVTAGLEKMQPNRVPLARVDGPCAQLEHFEHVATLLVGRWQERALGAEGNSDSMPKRPVNLRWVSEQYTLRRQLIGPEAERLFLSGSDEIPAEYRAMVEEYYRRLAERRR